MSILTPSNATCMTCRWFALDRPNDRAPLNDAPLAGTCRRHCPPWFDVADTDFCGDWASDYFPVLRHRDD